MNKIYSIVIAFITIAVNAQHGVTSYSPPVYSYEQKEKTRPVVLNVQSLPSSIQVNLMPPNLTCTGSSWCMIDKLKNVGAITGGCGLLNQIHVTKNKNGTLTAYVPKSARTIVFVSPKQMFKTSCISIKETDTRCHLGMHVKDKTITGICS